MYDVTIIGAGVIGASIARELSKYDLKVIILDKDNDVSNATTKANSAIVHAGYDAKLNTNMSKFNVKGNEMFGDICKELDVDFKRNGSLVVAFDAQQMETLKELLERGTQNGCKELEIINKERLLELEPNLTDDVMGALWAKKGGIVGAYEYGIALVENAMDNGVELELNCEVKKISKNDEYYLIESENKIFKSKYVVNAAGVYADVINDMVSKDTFKIKPRRGQYFVMDKSQGKMFERVIFQCPSYMGKGVLYAPTVHGNLIVGPDSQNLDDKEDISTTAERLNYVRESSAKLSTKVSYGEVITTFAGLRAESDRGDFILGEPEDAPGFFNAAGMKSPGLSSAPAIGEHIANLIVEKAGEVKNNESYNPKRIQKKFMHLDREEQNRLIKQDARYGNIICRCENITEGEIVDVIRRNAGAKTLDGVKRRCRPGTGRCQGGFCGPRVQEILSREMHQDIIKIEKDKKGSYILTGKTKV